MPSMLCMLGACLFVIQEVTRVSEFHLCPISVERLVRDLIGHVLWCSYQQLLSTMTTYVHTCICIMHTDIF